MTFSRGSEWRKWDLHVHTASSHDHKYKAEDSDELLVEAWREHEFAAVAITDHFIIDDKRIRSLRELAPEITIFPGFEMRTDKGAPNLHVVGIFPETSDLSTLKSDFDAILIRKYRKEGETDETIVRDLSVIVEFVKSHNGILTIHAGKKTNGIDEQITNKLEVSQAIKEDIASVIDMFEIGQIRDVETYWNFVFNSIEEKPLILCSDNHDPRNYNVKEYLWIKANPTFQGLIQTIMQPSERVFIGNIPDKLDKLNKNKSNHIESIEISRIENPTNDSENWFGTSVKLNPSLVTIIGNKGSGKSAFSDILGHLCKSNNMSVASFLNDDRFRKLPEKKSDDYVAQIKWYDEKVESNISLGNISRDTTIEEAQYLPQKYIESVCNDLSNEFQKEIDQVIFSYVDTTERVDATNLNELIENKSRTIQAKITEIKNNLDICNKELIRLEDRKTSKYKDSIKANLEKRKEDLKRHDENKPAKVEKPTKENDPGYEEKLKSIQDKIEELQQEEMQRRDDLSKLNIHIDNNQDVTGVLSLLLGRITSAKERLDEYKKSHNYSEDKFVLKYELPISELKKEVDELLIRKQDLQEQLDNTDTANDKSISRKLNNAKEKLENLISTADAAEKAYQRYLADLKEWETARIEIIGNSNKDGSLKFYENELNYIEDSLDKIYSQKLDERIILISEIYTQKKLIADIYRNLYRPIEKELKSLLENTEDQIEFDVSITLKDKDIGRQLLTYINQQMTGLFQGKADASATMTKYIKSTNFNDLDSLKKLVENILTSVSEDIDKSNQKVKDKFGFYSELCYLDYVKSEYNLKLGMRPLSMLSPGERGIVLLVFYLALSKNDAPLIIDQPEDNLDNQSVYARLVPCLLEAKKRRQVIIVTHNPNIAIACDAEQIICCSIDKKDNRINYKAGSIEDNDIRDTVVDILEGTMPAFQLRKLKYTYDLYSDS